MNNLNLNKYDTLANSISAVIEQNNLSPVNEIKIKEIIRRVFREFSTQEISKDIVKTCHRLDELQFIAGASGNVSYYLGEQRVIITPSGRNKGQIDIDDLVYIDLNGNKLCGDKKASSESKMHLTVYSNRTDIKAVVHAHPPFATGFAAAGIALDMTVLPEAILVLGNIPLIKYATPSTVEVPLCLEPYLQGSDVFLLSNHGALTLGKTLEDALYKMETLELFAKVIVIARMLGGEKLLNNAEIQRLYEAHDKL